MLHPRKPGSLHKKKERTHRKRLPKHNHKFDCTASVLHPYESNSSWFNHNNTAVSAIMDEIVYLKSQLLFIFFLMISSVRSCSTPAPLQLTRTIKSCCHHDKPWCVHTVDKAILLFSFAQSSWAGYQAESGTCSPWVLKQWRLRGWRPATELYPSVMILIPFESISRVVLKNKLLFF